MNSAREKILNDIRSAGLAERPACTTTIDAIAFTDKVATLVQRIGLNGGRVININNQLAIENFIHAERDAGKNVQYITAGEQLTCSMETLYQIDTAVITGGIAVAENGAVWVSEKYMGHRLLPFTCQQLVLIVEAKNIVHNMHEAYAAINVANTSYGVFIAGPSKTADIEQSLVIGAHGPLDHLVFLIS